MDCAFTWNGESLSLERVGRLFQRIDDQVAHLPTVNSATEFAVDYARFLISVDGRDAVPFADLHTGDGGNVYLSVLKPPHGMPLHIHMGVEAGGQFTPGNFATIRGEIAYVVRRMAYRP